MATIEFNDEYLWYLMGWLETHAEGLTPLPQEITDETLDQMAMDILTGKTAAPIDVLGQREPPVAWLLSKIYDAFGWPKAFNDKRSQVSRQLIMQALDEIYQEQKAFEQSLNEEDDETSP